MDQMSLSTLSAVGLSRIAFFALAVSAQASTQYVVNGSFEQTSLSASGQINSSDVTGWSSSYDPVYYNFLYFPGQATTSGVGAVDTDGSNAFVWLYGPNNGPTFPLSPDGGNFLAADADPALHGAISQTVTGLTVGQEYDLSFYWGAGQYTTRTGATTASWQVSLGGQTQSTGYISNASQSFSGWQQATMFFTATSASEVLSFLAVGTPSGMPPVGVLDGVSLENVTTPEPGYAILSLGMIAFMAILRARKQAKAARPAERS
jgi:hypothetical protein